MTMNAQAAERPILPVGWTVVEYLSTVELLDHTGRVADAVAKPYEPTPLGALVELMMERVRNGRTLVKYNLL